MRYQAASQASLNSRRSGGAVVRHSSRDTDDTGIVAPPDPEELDSRWGSTFRPER